MKNKPCKHRLEKDICLASWATPYDEIYECKTKRKGCPCYEEEMMDKHNSEYELGRQTENMDKSREWVKENDMNREQAHLITVADHKKIVSELEDNYRLSRECTETWKDTYFLAKDELSASQNRVKELERSLHIAEQNELSTKMQYDKVVAQGKVTDEGVEVNTDECKEKPIYKKGNWNTDRLQDIENLRTQEEGSENCC